MTRQQALTRPNPPRLWAVVDEAALRRNVGGRDVMRGQLERLIEASKLPNVTLQVLPFSVGSHSAEAGAFTILRFPDSDMPDIAYLEQLTSAIYLDKREDVDQYAMAMERVCIDAEPPNHTPEILGKLLHEVGRPA